jgi:nitronate monooxygenase
MRTPVCELLGIEQPIVLAPMVAVPRLAAAVSNAGALGMVTLTWSDDVGAVRNRGRFGRYHGAGRSLP